MAIESIASVKSHFETGDRPTQQEFTDLIDTLGRATPLAIASAAEGGKTGVIEVLGDGDVTARSTGTLGRQLLSVAATASAHNALGISSVAAIFLEQDTTASSQQAIGVNAFGTIIIGAATTASATGHLGGGTVGTAVFQAETTASAHDSIGMIFTGYFESSAQSVSAAGLRTIAHGLGAEPTLVLPLLVCVSADVGYTAGDKVLTSLSRNDSSRGLSIVPDSTNVIVRYAAGSASLSLVNKTTGAESAIQNKNWNLVIRAWK